MSVAATLPGWLVAAGAVVWAAALHRAAQRRAAVVARAAHELRGPLTAARLALHGAGREHGAERSHGAEPSPGALERGAERSHGAEPSPGALERGAERSHGAEPSPGALERGAERSHGAEPSPGALERWVDAIAVELDRTERALEDLEPAARWPGPPALAAPVRALPRRAGALLLRGGARVGRRPPASRPAGRLPRADGRAQPVDVAALLRAQGAPWAAAAPSVGRRVRLVVPPGALTVHGDRARLAQAVGNLIANAMEHGRGTVTLSATAAGAYVRVEVADEGSGLAAPVERLLCGDRLGGGRRGHGLAVAADVAAAHGGRLVTRPSRSGARLVLELPAASELRALPEAS
jgi:signal transduction histidine kinase